MPLVMKFANSVRFVLPRITAPAARRLRDDRGVLGRDRVLQRDAAGRRRQAGDVEVVLDQDRDAVQRAPEVAGRALEVEQRRRPAARRVDDPDGVDPRAARVDRRDPVDVGARELHARELARGQLLLQLGDASALEVERRVGGARRLRSDQQQPASRQATRTVFKLDIARPSPSLDRSAPQLNPARCRAVKRPVEERQAELARGGVSQRLVQSVLAIARGAAHTGTHDVLRAPCVRRRT